LKHIGCPPEPLPTDASSVKRCDLLEHVNPHTMRPILVVDERLV